MVTTRRATADGQPRLSSVATAELVTKLPEIGRLFFVMANPPLAHADAHHIAGILNAARQIIGSAQVLYCCGGLNDDLVNEVVGVQGELGKWLAFFEDGAGWGWAKPDALLQMRIVEAEACQLLALAEHRQV